MNRFRATSRVRLWLAGLSVLGLVGAVWLIPAASVAAAEPTNTVLVWNENAVNVISQPATATPPGLGQAPPLSALHVAMVHGAIYDAVNAIDGGHQSYLGGLPPASPTASPEAAVATAAHHVLVGLGIGLVPALPQIVRDRLDALYAGALAGIPDGEAKSDGIAAGAAAAAAMLAARAADGRYVPFSFAVGDGVGEWRPTGTGNDPFAWVAGVDPFLIESSSQFRTKGPHALTTDAYAKDYNEVKELGGPDTPDSPRTEEQTALARFYTVNPVELFNRTFRVVGAERGLTLVEEARLFAMVNMAGADGLISCWDEKAFWSFWRPVTAIHEGDNDGNPDTVGDAGWTPFIATPPYPEHASGYNCVTSSMMYTADAFFGAKRMAFSVVRIAPGVPNVTRVYERFTDVVDDTIDARVYLGIHFRAADVQGAGIGKDVAHWLDKHYFQSVN